MHAKIIAIGTSKGIRIPKYLLDKYKFGNEVDVEDIGTGILIKSTKQPRAGWQEAFAKIAGTADDKTIKTPTPEWDKDEWEW